MSHKHRKPSRFRESGKGREGQTPAKSTRPRLEIVLKGDTTGSVEGVSGGISEMVLPGVDISGSLSVFRSVCCRESIGNSWSMVLKSVCTK
jgi:hypothetical protein